MNIRLIEKAFSGILSLILRKNHFLAYFEVFVKTDVAKNGLTKIS